MMGRRLYVGNLPYTTGEAELQELFSKAGTVESVRVMRDAATGRARGFAFVEMATDEEAPKAALAAAVGTAATGAVVVAAAAASRGGNPMKNWSKGDRVVQPTYGAGTL